MYLVHIRVVETYHPKPRQPGIYGIIHLLLNFNLLAFAELNPTNLLHSSAFLVALDYTFSSVQSLSESEPGRFGRQQSSTDLYHTSTILPW